MHACKNEIILHTKSNTLDDIKVIPFSGIITSIRRRGRILTSFSISSGITFFYENYT